MDAAKIAARLQHDAHLRYQRQQLAPDASARSIPCSEVRGCKREPSKHERELVFQRSWFTGLRPNFWKGYFDTLIYWSR